MTIRFAREQDIPQMLELLRQVGQVHHAMRPDLFRAGAQKYDDPALRRLLADPNRPILAAEADGVMTGYAFCILRITKDDPVLCDRRELYIDDLCVDENHRGAGNCPRTVWPGAGAGTRAELRRVDPERVVGQRQCSAVL